MLKEFDSSQLYDRYAVVIQIRERLDGGVPKSPELIRTWVAAKTGFDDEITQKLAEEHLPDIEKLSDEIAESTWTGFKRDQVNGYYIEARQLKALMRESATLLLITKKKIGSKQIIQHGFEIRGHEGGTKVYLEDHSEIQNEEKAIHVMTPKGPRDALKRTDFVTSARLKFEVWILKTDPHEKRHLGEADLRRMLTHAQENGLGANRSQNSGKFDVVEFSAL